ncbi:MAG: hypothetical protein HY814_04270 [Candidatus Riflebacteria bacterium]|nr:hypothetical protein [Candidatus Riflebacteria bacterium]
MDDGLDIGTRQDPVAAAATGKAGEPHAAEALQRAARAMRAGAFLEAEMALRPFSEGPGADPRMGFYLGRSLRLQRKWQQAVAVLEPLASRPPTGRLAAVELAALYLQQDDLSSARAMLDRLADGNESDRTRFLSGWLAARLGAWDECRRHWTALDKGPGTPPQLAANSRIVALREARSLLDQQSTEDALAVLAELGEVSGASPEECRVRADLLFRATAAQLRDGCVGLEGDSVRRHLEACRELVPGEPRYACWADVLAPTAALPMPARAQREGSRAGLRAGSDPAAAGSAAASLWAPGQGSPQGAAALQELQTTRSRPPGGGATAGVPTPGLDPYLGLFFGARQVLAGELLAALSSGRTDPGVLHSLALCCYWDARSLPADASPGVASETWERALAAWASLMEEGPFWEAFFAERQAAYDEPILEPERTKVRTELAERPARDLAAARTAALEAGQGERAHLLHGLELQYAVERRGGRALREVSRNRPELPWGSLTMGPLMARLLGHQQAVGRLVSGLSTTRQQRDESDLAKLLEELLRQAGNQPEGPLADGGHEAPVVAARRSFSRLGPAAELLAQGQPNDGTRLFLQDALELAVDAHLRIARSCISGTEVEAADATAHWRAALQAGTRAGSGDRTRDAVRSWAIGARKLWAERRNLDQAAIVLEAAAEALQDESLDGLLAEALTDRGIVRARAGRLADAARDLRIAFSKAPHVRRTAMSYATVLRLYAPSLARFGRRPEGVQAVEEALKVLGKLTLEAPDDQEIAREVSLARSELAHVSQPTALESMIELCKAGAARGSAAGSPISSSDMSDAHSEARAAAARGQYELAISSLNGLLREREDPDGAVRETLRRTYLSYFRSALSAGDCDKANRILARARRQFQEDPELQRLSSKARATGEWC